MPSTEPRYPSEEFARRGKEFYEKIRAKVDPGNNGKILAIDIETGEWELGDDVITVGDRLFARLPDPQIFCLRIGHQAVYRFGGGSTRIEE
jgi:hypothetical protein